MPRPLPRFVLRLLERRIPPRLFDAVAGDLDERWRRDTVSSVWHAWFNLARLTLSVLWHARREARLSVGHSSPATGGLMLAGIAQDLRFAWRAIVGAPLATSVAVLTLGVGLGATVAIFTVTNGVFFTPLPYPDAGRLVHVQGEPDARWAMPMPLYRAIEERTGTIEAMAAWQGWSVELPAAEGRGWIVGGAASVSWNYFQVLGARGAIGRLFAPEDGVPGHAPVVVLSHEAWLEHFGGRPDVLGTTLRVGEELYEVIGVVEPGFLDPVRTQVFGLRTPPMIWRAEPPLFRDAEARPGWTAFWAIGRLGREAGPTAAHAEVRRIVREIHPDWSPLPLQVRTFRDVMSGHLRPTLVALLLGAGLVLLIGCANVANLLLSRAVTRGRELAIRASLGAPRRRLVRQLLFEGLLVSTLALLPALLLARLAISSMVDRVASEFRAGQTFDADWRVLAFAAAVAVVSVVVFALAPALHATDAGMAGALRSGTRSVRGDGGRLRGALIAAEVALGVLVLVGAGLLGRTLWNLRAIDPGFDYRAANTIVTTLPSAAFTSPPAQNQVVQAIARELSVVPGVTAAGGITDLPMSGAVNSTGVLRPGQSAADRGAAVQTLVRAITPGYFDAMGIRLLAGRAFTESDQRQGELVAIVNATFARRMFDGAQALDETVVVRKIERRIVGIVPDVAEFTIQDAEGTPVLYTPYPQEDQPWMRGSLFFVVRAPGAPANLEPSIRAAVARASGAIVASGMRPLTFYLDRDIAMHEFRALLLLLFGGAALFLASIGVASVAAYTVSRRVPEIGLRMALGATAGGAVKAVMRPLAVVTVIGLALGLVLAVPAARLLGSFLFGVDPGDPVVLLAGPLLMFAAALAGSWIPARRAAAVDPAVALRGE